MCICSRCWLLCQYEEMPDMDDLMGAEDTAKRDILWNRAKQCVSYLTHSLLHCVHLRRSCFWLILARTFGIISYTHH